ncbi:MAG: hypothetical protein ACLU98_04125 [Desulfovibrio fairfieldensis]
MQRLLWIGSPFFCQSLRSCGWQDVALHNFEDARVFCWEELVRLAGFIPDVLVVADKSRPPFVLGMERFPCLTVFYSVDSHIHSWQPLYAQGFDACMVSLRDDLELFSGPFLPPERVWWSPPFAQDDDQPRPHAQALGLPVRGHGQRKHAPARRLSAGTGESPAGPAPDARQLPRALSAGTRAAQPLRARGPEFPGL